MTTSSIPIRPEGGQESDAMLIHHGSLVPASGWAHCSFGQVRASWVTSGRRSNSLRNSPTSSKGSRGSQTESPLMSIRFDLCSLGESFEH
jgi:hypothetical protein